MAKLRKRLRQSGKGKTKKDSPLWQWVLVVVLAFGLYYLLDIYLDFREKDQSPPSVGAQSEPNFEKENSPEIEWSLERAEAFLPKNADPKTVF